jgi:hypothetical protein
MIKLFEDYNRGYKFDSGTYLVINLLYGFSTNNRSLSIVKIFGVPGPTINYYGVPGTKINYYSFYVIYNVEDGKLKKAQYNSYHSMVLNQKVAEETALYASKDLQEILDNFEVIYNMGKYNI